jgi:hypothetical protein
VRFSNPPPPHTSCPCFAASSTPLSAMPLRSIFLLPRITPLAVMSTLARQSAMRPGRGWGADGVVSGVWIGPGFEGARASRKTICIAGRFGGFGGGRRGTPAKGPSRPARCDFRRAPAPASASALKPPKTTECTAPMRAQASMAMGSSQTFGVWGGRMVSIKRAAMPPPRQPPSPS